MRFAFIAISAAARMRSCVTPLLTRMSSQLAARRSAMKVVESHGVVANEIVIEHRAGISFLPGQHFLHDPLQHSDVAVDADRQPEIA